MDLRHWIQGLGSRGAPRYTIRFDSEAGRKQGRPPPRLKKFGRPPTWRGQGGGPLDSLVWHVRQAIGTSHRIQPEL